MPRLSAIVPATDGPPTLGRCIAAIERAAEPPDELVVVDRADRPGPAAARNAGARRADGDVLVFVDADVLPHDDAFARMRSRFARDPGLAGVFGSYDDDPPPGVVAGFRNLLHHHVHQGAAGPLPTFWAGLGAIRRDVFDAAGGFDERYRTASIEDIELGLRIAGRGARVELDPAIQCMHLKAWTFGEMVYTDFARRGVPWVELMLSSPNGPASTMLNLGWRHRLSAAAALAGVASLLVRRPLGVVGALAALGALNASFYALLLRRRGAAEAALGIGLHAVHHLCGAASVPAGVALHAARLAAGQASGSGAVASDVSLNSRSSRLETISPSSTYSASEFTDQTS